MRFKQRYSKEIEAARSAAAYDTWLAIERACRPRNSGKVNVGAAAMLLKRLEKGG
jgi:hypothetical protein